MTNRNKLRNAKGNKTLLQVGVFLFVALFGFRGGRERRLLDRQRARHLDGGHAVPVEE